MRKLIIRLLFIPVLLTSCSNWETERDLSRLKELSINYPDSALFLSDVSMHPRLMNDENLVEWCFLNASLREQLNREMDMDTVFLNRAIAYLKNKKKFTNAAKAATYLGETLIYYQDYNRAVNVYLDALQQAERTGDYNLVGNTACRLADLYHKESNHKKAADLYQKASLNFFGVGNMHKYGLAMCDIAKEYLLMGKEDAAINLCLQADSVAHCLNDSALMSSATNYLGVAYLNKGKYDLAESHLLHSVRLDSIHNPEVYLSLSKLYTLLGKKEKTSFYLNQFRHSKDFYSLSSYWWQKYDLYKREHNVSAALKALEKFVAYQDTIWKTEDNLYVTELVKKYNYSQMEDENVILSRKFRRMILLMTFLSLVAASLYLMYKLKSDKVKSKDLELQLETIKRKKNELEVNRKNKELELLKKNELLMKQNLLKRSLMFTKIRMLSELRVKNPEAFQKETEKILKIASLTEEDWNGIKEEMDFAFPGFTDRISKQVPTLTEEEIRFCCLLKAGLDTAALATLLNINTTSVDRRRARINKKIREVYPYYSWQDFIDKF